MESREELFVQRLKFDNLISNNPELLNDFIKEPQKILDKIGISESALLCTANEHAAFDRAEKLSKKIEDLGDINPIKDLPRIVQIVESTFSDGFSVMREPFGLRFSEKVKSQGTDVTATGTWHITWGGRR
jgi:hypothetical protein